MYACLKIYKTDLFHFSYIITSTSCHITRAPVWDDSSLNINKHNSWTQLCNIERMTKAENIPSYCISIKVHKIQKQFKNSYFFLTIRKKCVSDVIENHSPNMIWGWGGQKLHTHNYMCHGIGIFQKYTKYCQGKS